jgi:hypothetical protein
MGAETDFYPGPGVDIKKLSSPELTYPAFLAVFNSDGEYMYTELFHWMSQCTDLNLMEIC